MLIKIWNVWERMLIYHLKYKKKKTLLLENINKNREYLGKNSFLSLKVKKDNIFHLENINKNRDCLGKNSFLSLKV